MSLSYRKDDVHTNRVNTAKTKPKQTTRITLITLIIIIYTNLDATIGNNMVLMYILFFLFYTCPIYTFVPPFQHFISPKKKGWKKYTLHVSCISLWVKLFPSLLSFSYPLPVLSH